jgi:hypothetical protein
MIDKDKEVVWLCRADASWGGCARADLIIVRESDLTDDERVVIGNDNSTTDEIHDVLTAAEARIHRDTCLCPKDTYKGNN